MELTKMSKTELLVRCVELGITKCKSKNKEELIKLICSKNVIIKMKTEANVETNVEKAEESKNVSQPFEKIMSISDSFVVSNLKLAGGKNGHGESRIYMGTMNNINEYICSKPWLVNYPDNYKDEIADVLSNDGLFSKECSNRKAIVYNSIDTCKGQFLSLYPQNGTEDVKRGYIGPGPSCENKKLYNTLRRTLIPKLYSFKLVETETYFECNIIKTDDIDKKQMHSKASNASVEWLNYESNKLGIEIQHEHNKGEFQLRNPINGYFWPVDGYHNCKLHKCSGDLENPCQYNNHIWEFQGDYFHGNPLKYDQTDTFHGISYSKKHSKDLAKQKFYEDNGYVVNIKWESEWVEDKKNMKKNNLKWY